MAGQQTTDSRHDDQRRQHGAHTVPVVHDDGKRPHGRDQTAEHQREIGNRQSGAGVPHGGAHQDLQIDQQGQRRRQPEQHPVIGDRCVCAPGAGAAPARRGEQRQRHGQAEEDLGQPGVRDGDRGRQEVEHGDAAQQTLQDDGGQGDHAETADPAAGIEAPQRHGQTDRQQSDNRGDQPVAVLVENPSHHLGQREREHEIPVGVRPVGHGQTRAGAGHHAAGCNQDERGGADQPGIPVEPDHGAAETAGRRQAGGVPHVRNRRPATN